MTIGNISELIQQATNIFDPIGVDGVRDIDARCDGFKLGTPNGDCETDGHYLCSLCSNKGKIPVWFNEEY